MGEVIPLTLVPDTSKKREAKPLRTFKTYEREQRAKQQRLIPEGHAVYKYADKIGLPRSARASEDYLFIAWWAFKDRYIVDYPDKKYRDWPRVFHTALKCDWLKLWGVSGSDFYLKTTGLQAQRAMRSENL